MFGTSAVIFLSYESSEKVKKLHEKKEGNFFDSILSSNENDFTDKLIVGCIGKYIFQDIISLGKSLIFRALFFEYKVPVNSLAVQAITVESNLIRNDEP